jgi:hypothetical protein
MDVPCGCVLLAYAAALAPWNLPATIHFQLDRWENNSWGFYDITRTKVRATLAVFSDGSRFNDIIAEDYSHYFIIDSRLRLHSIYLRSGNAGYRIYDENRMALRVPCCNWELPQPKADDSECSLSATDMHLSRFSGNGEIGGLRVVRYSEANSAETHEAAFAPAFGCEPMEEQRESFNEIGLPTSYYHLIVTEYEPGEPDPRLLQIPLNYRIVDRRY